jgi:hypothetical protein
MKKFSAASLSERLQYDPQTGALTWRLRPNGRVAANTQAGCIASTGYRVIRIDGRQWKAHRLVWLIVHGEEPAGDLDHVDGNRLNNRIENLREASDLDNAQNRRRANCNSATGLLGVSAPARRPVFHAVIRAAGKKIHIGTYQSADQAHTAYLTAKRLLHPAGTL